RKAEVYTHASGLRLGQVKWIIEDSGFALPVPMRAQAGSVSMAAPVPIATGEDMLKVKITVGLEIAPCWQCFSPIRYPFMLSRLTGSQMQFHQPGRREFIGVLCAALVALGL